MLANISNYIFDYYGLRFCKIHIYPHKKKSGKKLNKNKEGERFEQI